MKWVAAPMILSLSVTGTQARPALDAEDRADLRCIAAFAIIGYDQQRGAPGADAMPDLSVRGPRVSEVVRARLARERGLSADQTDEQVMRAIKALQDQAVASPDPQAFAGSLVEGCIARMASRVPPPAEPAMLRCAALSSIAYQDMLSSTGQTDAATGMAVLAAVLENEARKELRAQGKSGAESDVALGLEREAIARTNPDDRARVLRNGEELKQCMEMVKPPKGEVAH